MSAAVYSPGLRLIGRLAFLIYLAEHAQARWKRLLYLAAQHFEQPLVYDFCRLAAGLRNLITAHQLQNYLAASGDG
jgi:hypothetical protein